MRYEELSGPLQGWTYDEAGTIYTASGYKTTARQIEFCMWMYECMRAETRQWLIHSDEAAGALRPVFETSDLKARTRQTSKSSGRVANVRPDPTGQNARHVSQQAMTTQIKRAAAGLRPTPQKAPENNTLAVQRRFR